jgi:maltose alpha-D-glucosyltransferase/alpha-amylase
MLRSFDYAAWTAVMSLSQLDAGSAATVRHLADAWRQAVEQAFLAAYRETIAGCPSYPENKKDAVRLLALFLLEKALYEVCYEAANRPHWIRIPLQGVASLLELETRRHGQS